ncbi:MAG: MFS transporter [Bacillota bacterium]
MSKSGAAGIAAADRPRMSREAVVALVFLVLITVFLNADMNLLYPNAVFIEKDLGINDAQLGAVSSAFIIIGAAVTLLWGYLTDFASRKKLLLFTVLLGEIPCFMTAFSQTYGQLYFWRSLTGLGIGGIIPITYSLLSDYFSPSERGLANTWINMVTGLGVVLGMLAAGFIGPVYGWRLPFILAAVPNFVLVPLFYFFVKEPRRGESEPELRALLRGETVGAGAGGRTGAGGRSAEANHLRPNYLAMARVKTNILSFIQGIPGSVPWGVLTFAIPIYFVRERGFSVQAATMMMMVFGAGVLAGGFAGGLIGTKLYNIRRSLMPIFLGVVVYVGMFMAYGVVAYPARAGMSFAEMLGPVIMAFLTGFVASMVGPNPKTILMNVNLPENRGSISSIFNLTDSIGNGAGPFLGGLLSVHFGMTRALYIAISFWALCGFWWFFVARTEPRDEEAVRRNMRERAERMGAAPTGAAAGPTGGAPVARG